MGKRPVDFEQTVQEFYKRLRLDDSIITLQSGAFVITDRMRQALERVALCTYGSVPVIVTGPTGCGKSILLSAFAHLHDKTPIVLPVGEQSDPRTLVGTYTASGTGQFRWMPGILTEAVRNGRWVFIKDIHLASAEYSSLLRPLVESRRLVTNSGEIIAHPDFRIFATSQGGNDGLQSCFMKISVGGPLENKECIEILKCNFSQLIPLLPLIMKIYDRVCEIGEFAISATMRNLVRFCRRLEVVVDETINVEAGLDEQVRKFILLEVSDCFAAHLSHRLRVSALDTFKDILGLTCEDLDALVTQRKPLIEMQNDVLCIGRVNFQSNVPLIKPDSGLAPTTLTLQVLEKIAIAVKMNEPALLVGETGTGKTTMVQHLAQLLGQPQLVVLNLSQQSESSDLLGGFRPLSLVLSARMVVEKFEQLFVRTFSRTKNAGYLSEVYAAFQSKNWDRLIKLMLQVINMAKSKSSMLAEWTSFEEQLDQLFAQFKAGPETPFFAFLEGALVKALENGYWILLDEINLATSETLDILSGLLQDNGSLTLGERGDSQPIQRHPNFRLFACMNPATDISKRSLPPTLRSKFSEVYVDETDAIEADLRLVVSHCLGGTRGMSPVVKEAIVELFYSWKSLVNDHRVVDGSRKLPLLNLRTLTRALRFSRETEVLYGAGRALFEGLSMTFLTTLDESSTDLATKILLEKLSKFYSPSSSAKLDQNAAKQYAQGPSIIVENSYIVNLGPEEPKGNEKFVLTPSVRRNIANVARAVMAGGHPILLEGPTSAGKTSVVEFLALLTGHRFVRINNHEHTDIQEYIGAYQPDHDGKLVFKEGLLVEALRKGHWLVLDELNLAPSDVLEALNRLLDDNRELYVPELGEMIKPHCSFLLFATQNPAGIYGGRKLLSRAFRSRFIELQFSDLPLGEVELILTSRCQIAPSHASKISRVYAELQHRRTGSNLFAGRHSLVTLRDLFRWAGRPFVTIEDLARNGYLVLAERLRHDDEKSFVKAAIETILKVQINLDSLYVMPPNVDSLTSVTWTGPMKRLFSLVYQAVSNKEPVLLVGETGCGKTTVCQVLKAFQSQELIIVNCHQNTETADLIGSLRPIRTAESATFVWQDGPLVKSMREGNLLLLDEISLADDSVLERLNSVLEPSRTLTLAEAIEGEEIVAKDRFAILATMNPGGDYGKKELSPALRNRFTEIWVPSIGDSSDLIMILTEKLGDPDLATRMVDFVDWWRGQVSKSYTLKRWPFSIRDVLSWALFIKYLGNDPRMVVEAAEALFLDPARSVASTLDETVDLFVSECRRKLLDLFQASVDATITPVADLYHKDGIAFGLPPFTLPVVKKPADLNRFCFDSPTTFASLGRILRAMGLGRSILLEGSPGVGKTSIISAIAAATGKELVRINLSEQADLLDLFGSDMPQGGAFEWVDGPFLRALKRGSWILLDELNLASQSVLEGLNACLDHRGQVYLPELDKTFSVSTETRIFGAQNPARQGGGRKGLPKSFLNRFVTVWIDPLEQADMIHILSKKAPLVPLEIIVKAVELTRQIQTLVERREFAIRGAPWEFNLRDLFRWIDLAVCNPTISAEYFLGVIFLSRMRTLNDRRVLKSILQETFSIPFEEPEYFISGTSLRLGNVFLDLSASIPVDLHILPSQLTAFEALIACYQQGWLAILHGAMGKSSLVRLLAALVGRTVVEISLSSESDTADLLGSFEQTTPGEERRRILDEASALLGRSVQLEELQTGIFDDRVEGLKKRLEKIDSELIFEWKDGPLVRALSQGHWIVLDNCDSCPPSVLDRLNSLFEPNGSLVLSECASIEPRVIIPEPGFRVFMLCSGRGELSRAMRNRGLEIWTGESSSILERFDVVRAAGHIGNSVAGKVVERVVDWKDLGRVGELIKSRQMSGMAIEPIFSGFPIIRSFEGLSSQTLFWLAADDIKFFGGYPTTYQSNLIEYLFQNINICEFVHKSLLLLWKEGNFGIVVINKTGNLVNSYGNQIRDYSSAFKQATMIDKEWKRIWKSQLANAQRSDLVQHIVNLPAASNLYQIVSEMLTINSENICKIPSLGLNDSKLGWRDVDATIRHYTDAVLGPLCNSIKRVALISAMSNASFNQRLENSGHFFDGVICLRQSVTDTILRQKSFSKDLTVSQSLVEKTLKSMIVSNAVQLPLLMEELEKDLHKLADFKLPFSPMVPSSYDVARSLVYQGLRFFRNIITHYLESDPLVYYQNKYHRLVEIDQMNQDFVKCQTTLRLELFGSESIPTILQEMLDGQQKSLLKLEPMSKRDTATRHDLSHSCSQQVDSLLASLERWLQSGVGNQQTMLTNLRTMQSRLMPKTEFDITLPLIHAIDLMILGIEYSSVKSSYSECSFMIVGNSSFRSDTILQNGMELKERLGSFLLQQRFEQALGRTSPINTASRDILKNDIAEFYHWYQNHKKEDDSFTFDGGDDEVREKKIMERMFGHSMQLNPAVSLMRLVDKIFAPTLVQEPRTEIQESWAELFPSLATEDVRTCIEMAYRQGQVKSKINVYKDTDVSAITVSLNIMQTFAKRVDELLVEYPEHDVLQSLVAQCDRYANLPASTPIISLLTSLEQVLQKAQSWQSCADRAHSLPLDEITELIVNWRKMELDGWRQTLAAVDEEYHENATEKLLWLLQVSMSVSGVSLVGLVDTFLLSAPLGELGYRLEMLKRVPLYPICNPEAGRILRQVSLLYTAIENTLSSHKISHRKAIEAELKAALVTTVWRDKTYWSICQSVDRTHRLLAKQVRKYRELLDQPVSMLVTKFTGTGTDAGTEARKLEIPEKSEITSWKKPSDNSGLASIAFKRLELVLGAMNSVVIGQSIDDLATTIIERVTSLSKLQTQDSVQIKQQSFIELLRVLRNCGLRLLLRPDEGSVPHLIVKASLYKASKKTEEYLARSLAVWQELSNPAFKINEDLGVRQVEAARALVFRTIEASVTQRESLGVLAESLNKCERLVEEVEKRHKTLSAIPIHTDEINRTLKQVEMCLVMTRQAKHLLQPHLDFSNDYEELSGGLQRAEEILIGIMKDLTIPFAQFSWMESFMFESLTARLSSMPTLSFDAPVQDFMQPTIRLLSTLRPISIASLETSNTDLVKELLLLVQSIEGCIRPMSFELDEYGLYPQCFTKMQTIVNDFDLPSFYDKVGSILESSLCHQIDASEEFVKISRILVNFFRSISEHLAQNHRSSTKLSLVCSNVVRTLFAQGYCRPREEPKEEGSENAKEAADGTGMAEGSGEKNVSNEIEFEEQITDLMQDQKPGEDNEQNEAEKEENVEMRDDFDAQTGENDDDVEVDDEMEDKMGENEPQKDEIQELDDGWNEEQNAKDNEPEVADSEKLEKCKEEATGDSLEKSGDLEAQSDEAKAEELDKAEGELEKMEEGPENTEKGPEDTEEGLDVDKDDLGDENANVDQDVDENANEDADENIDENIDENVDANVEENVEEDDKDTDEAENVAEQFHSISDNDNDEQDEENFAQSESKKEESKLEEEEHGESNANENADAVEADNPNESQEAMEAVRADEDGTLDETIAGTKSSSRLKSPNRDNSAQNPIDQAMNKLQRSIHEILAQQTKDTEEENAFMEIDSKQLLEEADTGENFAQGAAAEHGDSINDPALMNEQGVESEEEQKVELDDEQNTDSPDQEKMIVKSTADDKPRKEGEAQEERLGETIPEFELPSWDEIESKTFELSMELCEQLRLVLEPTKATKLRGDYRTGKRLNLRKIPAYIASHYRRDKIWLRRTKPSSREYQITLSVDNSRSMRGGAGRLAVEALAMTATALSRLEVGSVGINSFGAEAKLLHQGNVPWTTDAGRSLIQQLSFKDESTDLAGLIELVNQGGCASQWQLNVILSDGICHDHKSLAQLINAGLERRIIHVFVILDPSVADISHVEYLPEGIKMKKYLETFPFQFYVVLSDINALPSVLADSIRQWFETVSLIDC